VSTGEYSSTQFYTVFIAMIFSSEAAAMFFQFTTSLTKAQGSINYVLQVRSQVNEDMRDDHSNEDYASGKEAASIQFMETRFSYPRRGVQQVLKGINAKVGQPVAARHDVCLTDDRLNPAALLRSLAHPDVARAQSLRF
jgi:ATP-binding cassette subfamily B (MDR/TAP) protein 1